MPEFAGSATGQGAASRAHSQPAPASDLNVSPREGSPSASTSGRAAHTVDVVVVTYNSVQHIERCIAALRGVPGLRFIVVDNDSQDETVPVLSGLGVEPIRCEENLGFARGSNIGWRLGYADFVLFLNPDAVLQPTALAVMLETLASAPDIGIVGPRFVYADGSLAFYQRRFPTLARAVGEATGIDRLLSDRRWSGEIVRDRAAYARPMDVDWIPGACLLIRRASLESLAGFDETFFMYCEDIDICRRVVDAGQRVRYEPAAVCVHVGSGSAPRVSLLPTLVRSRMLYAHKHSSPLVAAATGFVLRAGALARAGVGERERRGAQLRAALTRL